MRRRRFQAEDLTGQLVRVGGVEAVHALRVLRLKAGAEVELFDGRGNKVIGRIRSVRQGEFEVEVVDRAVTDRAMRSTLTIAVAMPKGERADWLVEKCAELGVAAIWPLVTQRGAVVPGGARIERWQRKAVQAAKQAEHAVVMIVEPPRNLAETIGQGAAAQQYYADRQRADCTLGKVLRGLPAKPDAARPLLVLIGPEGGWTEAERNEMEATGAKAVLLGTPTLRVETAAVAAAAIWAEWEAEQAVDRGLSRLEGPAQE